MGCRPGALTGELVTRLGAEAVAAVDSLEPFVIVARERHPVSTSDVPPRRSCPFPMNTRVSTIGGSRLRSGSVPRAHMRPGSTPSSARN